MRPRTCFLIVADFGCTEEGAAAAIQTLCLPIDWKTLIAQAKKVRKTPADVHEWRIEWRHPFQPEKDLPIERVDTPIEEIDVVGNLNPDAQRFYYYTLVGFLTSLGDEARLIPAAEKAQWASCFEIIDNTLCLTVAGFDSVSLKPYIHLAVSAAATAWLHDIIKNQRSLSGAPRRLAATSPSPSALPPRRPRRRRTPAAPTHPARHRQSLPVAVLLLTLARAPPHVPPPLLVPP